MCNILISINPEHVKNIMDGTKTYEYRKIECKRQVDRLIIYSTDPVKKVVGEAKVRRVLKDSPEALWGSTKEGSGITKSFFDSYYKGRDKAVAYEIYDVVEYEHPRELSDYGVSAAPQSFVYVY